MHSVYFPFTYVSEDDAKKLLGCFPQTIVLQPIAIPDQKIIRGIEYQTPITGDEEKIQKALAGYKNWAQLHQGSKLSYFRTRMTDIPFYNESSIASIRSDIKKRITEPPAPSPGQNISSEASQFAARLFLAIAHEHDRYQDQIQNDLTAVDQMEKKLFDELKGGKEDGDEEPIFSQSAKQQGQEADKEMLIDQRLQAWAQLAVMHSDQTCVYITTRKTVLDSLMELDLLDEPPIFELHNIPLENHNNETTVWKQALMDQLEKFAASDEIPSSNAVLPTPPDVRADAHATLTVHAAKNISPMAFFHRLSAQKKTTLEKIKEGPCRHTLICRIG